MSWTSPADIRNQVLKLWRNGAMLASLAGGEPPFPRRMSLKKPTSTELTERFTEVRTWIARLDREAKFYRLEWRELNHRILGANTVPAEIWIDSLEAGLALIGKEKEAVRFSTIVKSTADRQPQLMSWLKKRPLRALELAQEWPLFLDIISWLQQHPQPGIYLRQVDIAGVHSKFIEAHRGVLAELFDMVIAEHYIDKSAWGTTNFCKRYGFRARPSRLRFRLLDRSVPLLHRASDDDITVTGNTFAKLELQVSNVFITENEINFLAFPALPESMVIFGAGYGFEVLTAANWLRSRRIFYWGDIDTHGFAILDQLRTHFPAAASFLMDHNTLLAHRLLWGIEPQPATYDLTRLTKSEQHLYDELRHNRLGKNLRLEQERIGYMWVKNALGL